MATAADSGERCERTDSGRSRSLREVSFVIDALPLLPNAKGQKRHWAVEHRYRKAWHREVRVAVGTQRPSVPFAKARVELTRHSDKEPDADNLAASWKPVLDGLVRSGVLEDDGPAHVMLESEWRPTQRGKGCITVRVVEQ